MLKKAIISSIQSEDSNSTVKMGIAALFRIKEKLEPDPIPIIQAAKDREEITTLADSEERTVRSREVVSNVNLISYSDFTQELPCK